MIIMFAHSFTLLIFIKSLPWSGTVIGAPHTVKYKKDKVSDSIELPFQ